MNDSREIEEPFLRTGFGGAQRGRGVGERRKRGEWRGKGRERGEGTRTLISRRSCRWWHRSRKGSGRGGGSVNGYIFMCIVNLIWLHCFSLLSVISTLVALSSSTCVILLLFIPSNSQQFSFRCEIFWFKRDQVCTRPKWILSFAFPVLRMLY